MEIQKVDVLVIGGGGAGMRAALAAKKEGADVLLVSKTPIGKSTCTYLSGGIFSVATEGMPMEIHLERTLQAGKGVNDRQLAQILAFFWANISVIFVSSVVNVFWAAMPRCVLCG